MPDRSSPLYLWLASLLRDQIEAGHLEPHAAVPSERVLSERYSVSRMTARHALRSPKLRRLARALGKASDLPFT